MSPEEFAGALRGCGVNPGASVLAAVSGGADSVCLLRLLCMVRDSYPLRLICAHAEHGLRGAQSLEDQAFVSELCEKWGIPFVYRHLSVKKAARQRGMGLEEAARTLRYDFLSEAARAQGCEAIVLAHHRQDQAETLLLRAARGTDIRGLCAMRPRQGMIVRPLLRETPEQIRVFLVQEGIPWREDESNAHLEFSRNRVRHRILPEMRRIAPQADAALCRLAEAAARDEDYFAKTLSQLRLDPLPLPGGAALPVDALCGLHPALSGRALARLLEGAEISPASETIGAVQALKGSAFALNLPGGGRLSSGQRWLSATRMRSLEEETLLPGENATRFGRFLLCPAGSGAGDGRTSQSIPYVPGQRLTVGLRRSGEAMVPFSKKTPKPLARLIADAGVDPSLRSQMPIVRLEGQPIWLAGIRPSERCRSAPGAWQLRFIPEGALAAELRAMIDIQEGKRIRPSAGEEQT